MSAAACYRAEEACRLLCEAGAELSAVADHEAGLERLSELVVRSVADLCFVDEATPDGLLVRVAAAYRGPGFDASAGELRRYFSDLDSPRDPFARAARTGEPLLLPELPECWIEENFEDGPDRTVLRSLGVRSMIVVPLATHGRTLGVLTLAARGASRRYDTADLALAEELGRRAALVVESARLRREAEEASGARSAFVGTMSHEFRTPVFAISTLADLLIMGVPEPIPPAARKHAEHIRLAASHLEALVEQVLTVSRLEAKREAVRGEVVDLLALARDTAALIEPLARQKGLGFVVELPEDAMPVVTDPNKVRQILFNLLGNAVKFTDAGEVRLTVRVRQEEVRFEVRDTGSGIAPEHLERIWEPFWQADPSSGGAPGAGLGLGIVRQLVEMLGGETGVESEPGRGTVFHVALPVHRGANIEPGCPSGRASERS